MAEFSRGEGAGQDPLDDRQGEDSSIGRDAAWNDAEEAAPVSSLQQRAFDLRVRKILQSAPVPAGLKERILAGLRAGAKEEATIVNSEECVPAEPASGWIEQGALVPQTGLPQVASSLSGREHSASPFSRRLPTRWSRPLSGTLAACVLVGAVIWILSQVGTKVSMAALIDQIRELPQSPADASSSFLLSEVEPADDFLADARIRMNRRTRWRELDAESLGFACVAYDLIGSDGEYATLFVIPRDARGAPQIADLEDSPTVTVLETGEQVTSGWGDGERIYVLIVRGGERAFWVFVQDEPPLA